MEPMQEKSGWETLSPEEKRRGLFQKQKALLDTFLEHGAISKAQYEKSLHDLSEKMGFETERDSQ